MEDSEKTEGLLQLDVASILRSRIPADKRRFVPEFLFKPIERIVCQKRLNEVLREAYPLEGCLFAAKALEVLGVEVETEGLDRLPEGRYVFASNHPLGGLDGLALLSVLGGRFGPDKVKFPVNDMLMNVTPLASVFTPINKYGSQQRKSAEELNSAYASDCQIAIFPAGLVSRLHPEGGVSDLRWQKAFVSKAMEYDRTVVPVYIKALNRRRFYRAAHWRKKLGIKVNLEQVLLPSEVCHSSGMRIDIRFGEPVDLHEMQQRGLSPAQMATAIRLLSDRLGAAGK